MVSNITFEPKRVILHCSDTPDHLPTHQDFDRYGAKDIDLWHRQRGWQKIGYHFVVRRTGKLEHGRELWRMGAHCKGQNSDSLGICYVGRYYPTERQISTLLSLSEVLQKRYDLWHCDWYGHHEYNPGKECPGFSMVVFRRLLEANFKRARQRSDLKTS